MVLFDLSYKGLVLCKDFITICRSFLNFICASSVYKANFVVSHSLDTEPKVTLKDTFSSSLLAMADKNLIQSFLKD